VQHNASYRCYADTARFFDAPRIPWLIASLFLLAIAYSAALFWLSWCKHEHHRHRHDCLPFGKKQQHLSVSFERRWALVAVHLRNEARL